METYFMVRSKLFQLKNQILIYKTKIMELLKILFFKNTGSENLSVNQMSKSKSNNR